MSIDYEWPRTSHKYEIELESPSDEILICSRNVMTAANQLGDVWNVQDQYDEINSTYTEQELLIN